MSISLLPKFRPSKLLQCAVTGLFVSALIGTQAWSQVRPASALPESVAAQTAPQLPQIVERIDEDRLATLTGNTRREARAEYDRGPVDPNLVMGDLILVLRRSPAQQAAFEAFLASQQDASSPNFHHWLTPDQIGQKYGPAQADLDAVTGWLQNHGFNVSYISKDHLAITFGGMASQVQSAFHTQIHNLDVKGERHIANMADPKIPEALTTVVVGVKALHNFFPHPLSHLGPELRRSSSGKWERAAGNTAASAPATTPRFSAKPAEHTHLPAETTGGKSTAKPEFGVNYNSNEYNLVVPYDLATIYNFAPLWKASTDGTGQTIAIAGTSNIDITDVNTFRKATGLSQFNASGSPTFKAVFGNSDPGSTSASLVYDRLENTVDVEWSGAVAKNANIILVASTQTTASTDPLYVSEQYIVDNVTAKIMNVSYGDCELDLGTAGNTLYSNLWSKAQGSGIAVFVATGDSGSASCDQENETSASYYAAAYGLQVSGLSSTPYNVAVGGTDFNSTSANWGSTNNSTNLSNAQGYIPETPWNDTVANPLILAGLNANNGNSNYDAESWANAILSDYESNQISLDTYESYIEATGGTGGISSCTINSTTATSTSLDPTSCSGGYAKPSWQTGVTGISASANRTVPDVSFFASNGELGTIYAFCDTLLPNSDGSGTTVAGVCDYTSPTDAITQTIGGTSVASPVMAGVMALINQKAGSSQGNPNSALYKLAAKQSYGSCSAESVTAATTSCYFNDIDTGNNAVPCDPEYSPNCPLEDPTDDVLGILSGEAATVGYDNATGLGSLNVANVVNTFAPAVTTAPTVTFSPTSLTFSSTTVGTASAVQTVTLKNTGNANLTISLITITGSGLGSFTETDTCAGKTVAAGATCTLAVTFDPASAGTITAALNVADNATGTPQSVTLTGTGAAVVALAPAITLTPTSLTFPSTPVLTSAPSQTVTVKNTGTAPLVITTLTTANGQTGQNYISASPCGTVAPGATCTVTVTFTPTIAGTLTATLSFTDNAANSPQTVSITGTGAEPTGASYTLAAAAVTIAPGASGTSAITATGTGGYVGPSTVTLSSCVLATSPSGAVDAPTCSITASTVTFASGSGSGAGGSVTIGTTGPSSSVRHAQLETPSNTKRLLGFGGLTIAGILLFGIPARKRNWKSMLTVLIFMAGFGILSGCGGGSSKTTNAGTTAGAYTFTITGADSSGTPTSATLTVTVN